MCRMLDGGVDPLYIARRLMRMSIEDIGLADPRGMEITTNAVDIYERLGSPEGELALANAVVYLACAPKSVSVYKAFNKMRAFVKQDGTRPVPMHIRNAPTKLMQKVGNGAGKTTTLHAITGLVPIRSGSVIYDGHDLRKTDPSRIVTMGLAHVPEGRQVFTRMTVAENLAMGAYFRKDKKAIADDLERVYARFPRLKERAKQLAGTLSGGEQQMLAVGRALMSRPKLLLLDEPSLGLAPLVVQDIFSIIREINKQGVTVLLVEQNANMALKIADLAYVLETGTITMSGTGAELLADQRVKEAYLGKSN